MLYERKTGKTINLTEKFDRSVEEVIWSPDSKYIFFTAEDQGYVVVMINPRGSTGYGQRVIMMCQLNNFKACKIKTINFSWLVYRFSLKN